ncbi:hypothetical protein D9V84_10465 [Bacteroidetes/Chlorobi group bacterium Naka2016]|jgi:hypothetical protein|nr:MAG: hypothetical protein D9V84_10465 [Bacteroidetes/Chlorobi group bacterium Naka2016]
MSTTNHFKCTNLFSLCSQTIVKGRTGRVIEILVFQSSTYLNPLIYNEVDTAIEEITFLNFAEKCRKSRILPKILVSRNSLRSNWLTLVVPKNRKFLYPVIYVIYILYYPLTYIYELFLYIKGERFSANVSNSLEKRGLVLPKILYIFRQLFCDILATPCNGTSYVAEKVREVFSADSLDFRHITLFCDFWKSFVFSFLSYLVNNFHRWILTIFLNHISNFLEYNKINIFVSKNKKSEMLAKPFSKNKMATIELPCGVNYLCCFVLDFRE